MHKTVMLGFCLLGLDLAGAGEAPRTDLTVETDGFADAEGVAVLKAYDSLGKMDKDPPRFSLASPINGGSAADTIRVTVAEVTFKTFFRRKSR